jgi:hypothetical protein
MRDMPAATDIWPALPFHEWTATRETLHLWLQIAGKIRWSLSPAINHAWTSTFYVTPTGLTTSPIPAGQGIFQIDFDFLRHRLDIVTSAGGRWELPLTSMTVADFHRQLLDALSQHGISPRFLHRPNELADATPFAADTIHRTYDPEAVTRFWRALVQADRVLKQFRARFIGKCSPVHLFWGAMDLAVTRFSGRTAPEHPGGIPNLPDRVTREAYSHEVSSCGFWPGSAPIEHAAFYSYAYPEPEGFPRARVGPERASYHPELREFVLPYDAVRESKNPDDTLLTFLQSTYEAAADSARWDRAALER